MSFESILGTEKNTLKRYRTETEFLQKRPRLGGAARPLPHWLQRQNKASSTAPLGNQPDPSVVVGDAEASANVVPDELIGKAEAAEYVASTVSELEAAVQFAFTVERVREIETAGKDSDAGTFRFTQRLSRTVQELRDHHLGLPHPC